MKPGYDGFSNDGLVALNRKTKQIDRLYKFEATGLGSNSPHLSDGLLYQLDTTGVLHFFKKDN